MLTAKLGFIDWCVCIAYLAVVFGLALKSVKGQENNEDSFVGGSFAEFHPIDFMEGFVLVTLDGAGAKP